MRSFSVEAALITEPRIRSAHPPESLGSSAISRSERGLISCWSGFTTIGQNNDNQTTVFVIAANPRTTISELRACASIVDYKNAKSLASDERISDAPVILVGTIIRCKEIGRPRSSKWDARLPMQLWRTTVRVENVLRGDPGSGNVNIYFFMDPGPLYGPPRLGVIGKGGTWHLGDREIFFLRRDGGVLRTVFDIWGGCVEQVLTGPHPGYKPRPGESVQQMIVDILLDQSQEIDNEQMAYAVFKSRAFLFDLPYAVRKLQFLETHDAPVVQDAARRQLDELERSWPQIREGRLDSVPNATRR